LAEPNTAATATRTTGASGPVRTLRLYLALSVAAIRAQAQYRGNLLLMVVGGFAFQAVGLAFIWIVIDRFGTIGGWSLAEVVFLYALRLCAHGLWLCFFNQIVFVDQVIREGEFDRYLVRPLNPLVQLITRGFALTAFGDLAGGVALLVVASTLLDVDWSLPAVLYMVLAIAGGALVEASIQLLLGSLGFRLLSTGGIRFVGDDLFSTFGPYPLKIFPIAVQFGLTFVVPLAFVAYLPAAVLLGRTGELAVPAPVAYLAPLLGGVLIVLAYRFWRYQSRFYTSSGH
jgi:viologen exporter family transport system permease protein